MIPARQMLLCIVVLHMWMLPLAHEAAYEATKYHCIKRDGTPTLQQLTQLDIPEKGVSIRIMDTIGSDYHTLGTYLLNDTDGGKLKTIERDYRLTADIVDEIFQRWIRGHQMRSGKKTNTWEKLVEYLRYARLMALADEIETVLRFCSEITMRMDNSKEYEIDYNHQREVPLQCHGYSECKCIAPIDLEATCTYHPQFFMLVVAMIIAAVTICRCKAVSKSLTSTPKNNIIVDGPGIHIPEAEDIKIKIQTIQMFTPNLVSAVGYSVNSVAEYCLSTGLISEECYESATDSEVGDRATRARFLLQAVKSAIKIKHHYFELFLESVLDKALAREVASELIKNMKEQVDARQQNYQDNKILFLLQHGRQSLVREPEMIRFRGCLATRKFQEIDKAFQVAVLAGQVEYVESAAEEMSNRNPEYKAIGLLYRARCRVMIDGRLRVNEALADCDRAIEIAKPMENGVLITLRALCVKLFTLRTEGQLERALECLQKARGLFSTVARSYDSAAFLYEETRLKLITEDKTTYSQCNIQLDYERALRHVDCSTENQFIQLFIFGNSMAEEALLKSCMIRDEERLSPAPTEQDLSKAEKILNSLPINQLPEEGYIYRGWHYLAQSDLYTWRKQYAEAKEWTEKSLEQFEKGRVSFARNVAQRRLKLLKRLESHN